MTTPSVFHYYSELPAAPTLNGAAGSLIAVLDACLVDGFGLKTADSLVVADGKATINISTGHSFEADIVVLVSGATPAALNGLKVIESRTTNTAVFDATGIADGAATGAVTVKIAPAGWSKVYSGTNLAVYRSSDVTGTRMFLRVADGTTSARVVGYESMSDADTGVQAFPLSSQLSGGGYWSKANAANATARAWTLIADSRAFYLHAHTGITNPGVAGITYGFGDFISRKSGDPYACSLWASNVDQAGSGGINSYQLEYMSGAATNGSGPFVARSFTSLGGALVCSHCTESFVSSTGASGATTAPNAPTYPNGPDNSLILTRQRIVETGVADRGVVPGVFVAPQVCHTFFNRCDKIDGQGQYVGRKLLAVKCGSPTGTVSSGVIFFDITGPWGWA